MASTCTQVGPLLSGTGQTFHYDNNSMVLSPEMRSQILDYQLEQNEKHIKTPINKIQNPIKLIKYDINLRRIQEKPTTKLKFSQTRNKDIPTN